MNKLKQILCDQSGNGFPMIIAIALVLLILLVGISEYMRLLLTAAGIRDAVQSSIIAVINDNYDDVYHSTREGTAASYQPIDGGFEESLDTGDIYGRLDETLGLRQQGSYHIKYAGETMEFRISGLSLDFENGPLAPGSMGGADELLATATLRLEVPVRFGNETLPPMHITLKVQAEYIPVF